jgi:Raf kinase inhibitor-like YbhB/YbcL family protein
MMRNQLLIAFVMAAASLPAQTPTAPPAMRPRLILETTAFEDGGVVPVKYSQAAPAGAVSPRLTWNNVPDGTVSFAVLVIDPDTALNKTTDQVLHWGIFNIPAAARELPEGVASDAQLPDGSIQLINQNKKVGYLGMGAPAGGPYHHYTFALYALDTKLVVAPDASMADAMKTMDGHILAKAVLVGRFHRP